MSRLKYPEIVRVPREVADNATEDDKEKAMELVAKVLASIGMDCYILSASNIEQVNSGTGEQVLRLQCSDKFATMHILKMFETLLDHADLESILSLTAVALTAKRMIRKKVINLVYDEEDD